MSSSLMILNPTVPFRLEGRGGSPQSGQAPRCAAAAGVKRSRQCGQQRRLMAEVTTGSFRAGGTRTRGRPGSSRGGLSARHRARSTRDGARGRKRAGRARNRGKRRWLSDRVGRGARSVPAARSALRRPLRHRVAGGHRDHAGDRSRRGPVVPRDASLGEHGGGPPQVGRGDLQVLSELGADYSMKTKSRIVRLHRWLLAPPAAGRS